MSKRKDIIRIGDTVRVVNPLIVNRVGYEFDYHTSRELLYKKIKTEDAQKWQEAINRLLNIIGIKTPEYVKLGEDFHELMNVDMTKMESEVLNSMAFVFTGRQKKQGNVRSVYVEEVMQYINTAHKVADIESQNRKILSTIGWMLLWGVRY